MENKEYFTCYNCGHPLSDNQMKEEKMNIDALEKKEILITGGTGSLGKTLVKLLIKEHNPKGIRIFSRDELKQWQMAGEIKAFQKEHEKLIPVSYIIGDVREYESLYRAFNDVDIVINTAAMKQVPVCEDNPLEAVMTNINGVQNIIKAALARGVSKVMQVSTDKAVHPTNLYGATKATAEKLIIQANVYSGIKKVAFSCCRYGNVIGSRGSIVPLFKGLIEQNKSIPLTDADMTRFWISLPEAGTFILKSICEMEGKEIFIPVMQACKVTEIIEYLAGKDYPVHYIGIRQGEKIHECLLSPEERRNAFYKDNKSDTIILLTIPAEINADPLYSDFYLRHRFNVDDWHLSKKEFLKKLQEEV